MILCTQSALWNGMFRSAQPNFVGHNKNVNFEKGYMMFIRVSKELN